MHLFQPRYVHPSKSEQSAPLLPQSHSEETFGSGDFLELSDLSAWLYFSKAGVLLVIEIRSNGSPTKVEITRDMKEAHSQAEREVKVISLHSFL